MQARAPPAAAGAPLPRLLSLLLLFLLAMPAAAAPGANATEADIPAPLLPQKQQHAPPALARVDLRPGGPPLAALGLPVYAHYLDSAGQPYLLTLAPPARLAAALAPHGLSPRVLDADAAGCDGSGIGSCYLLVAADTVQELSAAAEAAAAAGASLLLNDGRRLVLRRPVPDSGAAAALAAALDHAAPRASARPLAAGPLSLVEPPPLALPVLGAGRSAAAAAGSSAPGAAASLEAVAQSISEKGVRSELARITGAAAVRVGGRRMRLTRRQTDSGEAIARATQYVFDQLSALGLQTAFHEWAGGSDEGSAGFTGRNVVAEKPGATSLREVIVIVAHLDGKPAEPPGASRAAPAADDDGSGVASALQVARALAGGSFDRTLRWLFTTGEEQGQLGSAAYVQAIKEAGENITGVLMLDMLGFNSKGSAPTFDLHVRPDGAPGAAADRALAEAVGAAQRAAGAPAAAAVVARGKADGEDRSDHAPFWWVARGRGWFCGGCLRAGSGIAVPAASDLRAGAACCLCVRAAAPLT
jgi:hypothetical protein